MTTTDLKTRLARFVRNEDGSIAVELVIIVPMLFWAYLAMFATFDAYRAYSLSQKASYTVSDMISRETTPIDRSYIDGLRKLHSYLVNERLDEVQLRVTSVSYDADQDELNRDWSYGSGGRLALTDSDVREWHDRLPVMADGERLTVVETWVQYQPPFNTGLSDQEIRSFVFTKPRYADRVLFTGS